jgi:ubiquinone/menaquinone biosynthesis C-methylase UbiE
MSSINWATPLYEFLRQCDLARLPKTVLDCGAGGDNPPLALFYQYGYSTCGIDIQQEAVAKADRFCKQNRMALNIILGDMRHIPMAGDSVSSVYSFNAVFFMTKPDIAVAMHEMERVLRPGGLLYVNFKSTDEPYRRPFCESAYARRLLGSENWSYYADNEADAYFAHFVILRKAKLVEDKLVHEHRLHQVYIEYTARKLSG